MSSGASSPLLTPTCGDCIETSPRDTLEEKMLLSVNLALALFITPIAADGKSASGHDSSNIKPRDNADMGTS